MSSYKLKKLGLIFALILCISALISVSSFSANAEEASFSLNHYVAADFTATTTSNFDRLPSSLDRAPDGTAYVYTAADKEKGYCTYGFKGINSLEYGMEAVVFWVGQELTADGCYLSANYKLNFQGITANRKEMKDTFYFIPTDGGEICSSHSPYNYSLFDSSKKHGDFIEGWVVIPLTMYDDATRRALSETENLEIRIVTNTNKSYVAADGTVTNTTDLKAQTQYIASLGFVTDINGFLAQFIDYYSDESIYSSSAKGTIYENLTAEGYVHFRNKVSEELDPDLESNAVKTKIAQMERLQTQDDTAAWSPLYSISSAEAKTGKINSQFSIGAKDLGLLNGMLREALSGFKAPDIELANGGLRLSWKKLSGADNYKVRAYDKSGKLVSTKASKVAAVTVSEIKLGDTYTFQIDAYTSSKYLGSSACVTYDYVAYTAFDGTINKATGISVSRNPEEIQLEAAPSGKAVAITDTSGMWQKMALKTDLGVESFAVWIGQSGRVVDDKTYYEQRMVFININGTTVYGSSAGGGTAINYIIPTDGNTSYAVSSNKNLALNKPNTPYLQNAGCYYVFSLDALSDDKREYVENLVASGEELRVTVAFGSNVSYMEEGATAYVTDSTIINNITNAANTYYYSNILLISDLDKFLSNNGITPISEVDGVYNTGEYFSAYEDKLKTDVPYSKCNFAGADSGENSIKASFLPSADFSQVEFSYSVATADNAADIGEFDVKLTENAGMSMSFTAPVSGSYYLSSTLEVKTADTTVNWRTLTDSDGKKEIILNGTASYGASGDFGNKVYHLKAGDMILIEAYCDSAALINIGCPIITLLPSDAELKTVTYKYFFDALNLAAVYGYNCYKTEYDIQSSNPWRVYAVGDDETKYPLDTLNITDATDNANAVSAETDIAYVQPISQSNGIYKAQTVINPSGTVSYEFTMPTSGDISVGGFETEDNLVYRSVINGVAGQWQTSADTEAFAELTGLAKGDTVEYQFKNSSADEISYLTSDIYAEVTVKRLIYGDMNDDGYFTLTDLVHAKKYFAGVIDDLNNRVSVGSFADENSAQLLTVVRKSLVSDGTIREYIKEYE